MAPENSLEQSQSQSTGGGRKVDETLVTQGTVLWLPAKEDLPKHAVRRAHGKGAVEEGIFNHPIVVVSRPKDQSDIIHFHLVTSNKGKRLNELYSKDSEFHASRRSWFLPVGPDLKHPDARSKKTKKRTLELSDGATLNFESYVNIRHVYKIDLSLLQTYANPDRRDVTVYQFEKESFIRMLAKTNSLTFYEPVLQIDNPQRAQLEQVHSMTE
ncbi:hypothetical protein HBH62_253810 [Parastagonospora nodorum]|nr:hypothetical protein HBH62_253810 [Parastagonospora nodorum]